MKYEKKLSIKLQSIDSNKTVKIGVSVADVEKKKIILTKSSLKT